ncbi:MAG: hypothetical protein HPY74_01465 [Firmicutes bacterium]|nr:hypothetical protein [Bacillota bacterium]
MVGEEKLERLADEAIKQIKDKKYYKDFEGEGFKETLLMGISHHKKQCVVKTEYLKICIFLYIPMGCIFFMKRKMCPFAPYPILTKTIFNVIIM